MMYSVSKKKHSIYDQSDANYAGEEHSLWDSRETNTKEIHSALAIACL